MVHRRTGICGLTIPQANAKSLRIRLIVIITQKSLALGDGRTAHSADASKEELGITSSGIPLLCAYSTGRSLYSTVAPRLEAIYRNGDQLCNCATSGSTTDGKGLGCRPGQAQRTPPERHSHLAPCLSMQLPFRRSAVRPWASLPEAALIGGKSQTAGP
jgi:hypothetical protein